MSAVRLRVVLLACVLPPLASACASVSLAELPPPAAPAAAAREPAPRVEPPSLAPAESIALEPAAAPPVVFAVGAPAQPLPPAESSPTPPTPGIRAGEGAAPSPAAPGAAAIPAPAATGATATVAPALPAVAALAPGRWSVQLGVFAVEANAQSLRERLAQRLAQAPPQAGAADLRTVRRGDRTHVVIGDLPDRTSALRLAAQLRELLRQDLVLFQW